MRFEFHCGSTIKFFTDKNSHDFMSAITFVQFLFKLQPQMHIIISTAKMLRKNIVLLLLPSILNIIYLCEVFVLQNEN